MIAARTAVLGAATFVTALVAVGIVVPVGMAILKGNGIPRTAPDRPAHGEDPSAASAGAVPDSVIVPGRLCR